MNRNIVIELLLIIALVLLTLTALDYNPYWMPMGLHLSVLLGITILFILFATFVWREQGGDERERALLNMSDRFAFLAGSTVLMVAVLVEGVWMHMGDPWVLGALTAMVSAKAVAYMYYQNRH